MTQPNELEEKLKCAFADVGAQLGEVIRCLVSAEIASHMARIEQLNAVLNTGICTSTPTQPENGSTVNTL
jgi:hypothetical protein